MAFHLETGGTNALNVRLFLILFSILGALCLVAFAFITFRPKAWGALVDRENDFWVRRGWFSAAFAEKMKALEKGIIPRLILGAVALICVVIICVLLRAPPSRPLKAMPPPVVPIQRRPPAH